MKPHELGNYGEKLAVQLLKEKNHTIVQQNYKKGRGELDIVSFDGNVLVITEVKARNSNALGAPYSAVSRKKQSQLVKLANAYIQENKMNHDVRFDIISIVHNQFKTTIEHIEHAFYPIA